MRFVWLKFARPRKIICCAVPWWWRFTDSHHSPNFIFTPLHLSPASAENQRIEPCIACVTQSQSWWWSCQLKVMNFICFKVELEKLHSLCDITLSYFWVQCGKNNLRNFSTSVSRNGFSKWFKTSCCIKYYKWSCCWEHNRDSYKIWSDNAQRLKDTR